MRPGGGDLEPLLPCQLHDAAPEGNELIAYLGRRVADRRPHFHDRLVQFGFDLPHDDVVGLQDLRDI